MTTQVYDTDTPGGSVFWVQAASLLDELDRATGALARSAEVPDDVNRVVHRLLETIGPLTAEDFSGGDPYLVESALAGVVGCAAALWVGDGAKQRRDLRVPLERTRQALRDLLSERHVATDRPAKEVARWLGEVSGVPQPQLAGLIGVAPRTFQRWVSMTETAAPAGDDETRLRTLARTVDQLRWSMTPAGVFKWLERPHPALGGRRPSELLGEPTAYRELPRLAASTRAMVAS